MVDGISIQPIAGHYIGQLVGILNNDRTLCEQLSSNFDPITPEQFTARNIEWAQRNNSLMFAIVHGGEAIGMISLSHIDSGSGAADVGYWLSSAHWNKGFTSSAFMQLLAIAKGMNLKTVRSKIDTTNAASRAIWERRGASFVETDGKLLATLAL